MAYLTTWNITDLPSEMIDILEKDIEQFDDGQDDSRVMGNEVVPRIRNSKNAWIPTDHWIGGWIWYYIQRANRENFLYDLWDIDGGSIQYTHYEPGDYYTWHVDGDITSSFKPNIKPGSGVNISEDQVLQKGECVRKLSFSLQLSDAKIIKVEKLNLLILQVKDILHLNKKELLLYLIPELNIVFAQLNLDYEKV